MTNWAPVFAVGAAGQGVGEAAPVAMPMGDAAGGRRPAPPWSVS